MYFDYVKFENELFTALDEYARFYLEKKDDFYIMAIELQPFREAFVSLRGNTYSYIKNKPEALSGEDSDFIYSEEEWDCNLIKKLEQPSEEMQKHYNELDAICDEEMRDELHYAHLVHMVDACKNALKKFRTTDIYKLYPKLFLNFYIKGYYTLSKRITIFNEINDI